MIITKRIKSIAEKCVAPKDFVPVNVLSWHKRDTKYFTLSPYHLKTDGNEIAGTPAGVLFENMYQATKVYPNSYKQEIYCHPRFNGNPKYLWWKWDENEKMFEDNDILPHYYKWRQSLWDCSHPIRYPVGITNRKKCLFSFIPNTQERLDYITARKRIYVFEYCRLIRMTPEYKQLVDLVKSGTSICIFEIDVPDKTKRGNYNKVNNDDTFVCTKESINLLINDPTEAFGHGLCIAKSLIEDLS